MSERNFVVSNEKKFSQWRISCVNRAARHLWSRGTKIFRIKRSRRVADERQRCFGRYRHARDCRARGCPAGSFRHIETPENSTVYLLPCSLPAPRYIHAIPSQMQFPTGRKFARGQTTRPSTSPRVAPRISTSAPCWLNSRNVFTIELSRTWFHCGTLERATTIDSRS